MKSILKTSAVIALLATFLDLVFHIAIIPGPLSPPLYFIVKFGIGFAVAFVFSYSKADNWALTAGYGILSGVLFAIALYVIPGVGTIYTIAPHLAHIGVYGIAYYTIMKLEV